MLHAVGGKGQGKQIVDGLNLDSSTESIEPCTIKHERDELG